MTPEQLKEQLFCAEGESQKGNYELAINSADEIISEINSRDSLSTELAEIKAKAMLLLANSYGRKGEFDYSLELANQTLALAEEFHFTIIKSKVWNLLGNVYQRLSEFNKSIEYYEKAAATYIDLEENNGLAGVLGNIGSVYVYLGAYEKALEYFEKALATHQESDDKSGMASATCNIGIVHTNLGIYDKAIEYYEKALRYYTELEDNSSQSIVIANMGSVHRNIGSYDKALEYFEIACGKHNEHGEKREVANVTSKMASLYIDLGLYEKSLELYERARAMYQELGDTNSISIVTGNIGNVYYNLGSYTIALENHVKSLTFFKELGNKAGAAYLTQSIANDYCYLQQFDEALHYGHESLQLAEDIGDKNLIGYCWSSIGNTLNSMGRTKDSMIYFKKALDLRRNELNTQDGVADNLLSIGSILLAENKLEEAMEILNEALTTATELGEKRYLMDAHQSLAILHEKLNNPIKELEHFKLYHAFEKEVLSEEARKQAELLEQRRQAEEREKQFAIANAAANAKHQATEELLHNVLPPSIAHRMLSGEKLIAEKLPSVSVLFADIVNFTKLSQRITPEELVEGLDRIFSSFDNLAEKYGLEKIKTIGDAYMVVSGAPVQREDHAVALVNFALEMLEAMKEFRSISTGEEVQLRIGIHSGEVVAGVIGKKKFAYDMWGDAVNTASRMESHGEAGKIHVSEEFMEAFIVGTGPGLSLPSPMSSLSLMSLRFAERGKMDIKGKGMMKTYFLEKIP